MELSKHSNHRNTKYLAWLRTQNCVVSGNKAQCAHHVRIGTNGGSGLKPSDYFCIPLLNEYHTTGSFALHIVGEDTFLNHFNLNKTELFIVYLKKYLAETFDTLVQLDDQSDEFLINYLIQLIEEKGPKLDSPRKKTKKKKPAEDEYYLKAKESKRIQDKEIRDSFKLQNKSNKQGISPNKEYYEKTKELKRQKDKELRAKLKLSKSNVPKDTIKENSYYEQAKEARKEHDKKLRDINKEKQSIFRKEQYRKAKEYKANLSSDVN